MKTLDRSTANFKLKIKQFIFVTLLAFVFVSTASTCKANEPNPDLWLKGTTNNSLKQYFYIPDLIQAEKSTYVFEGYKIVTVWILYIKNDGSEYKVKKQFYLNPYFKKTRNLEWIAYNNKGKITSKGQSPTNDWQSVIPESLGEIMFNIVDIWSKPLSSTNY